MKPALNVAITGAAGQIGYALAFRVASGQMLGPDQPVNLHLLEITPALPGLHVEKRQDDQLTLEYTGELPDLLAWLAQQTVAELRIEPLGLHPIYYRYHGSDGGKSE